MSEEDAIDFIEAKKIMADRIQEGIPNQSPLDVFRIEIKIHPIDEIAWVDRKSTRLNSSH